jgi:hypothetical protein
VRKVSRLAAPVALSLDALGVTTIGDGWDGDGAGAGALGKSRDCESVRVSGTAKKRGYEECGEQDNGGLGGEEQGPSRVGLVPRLREGSTRPGPLDIVMRRQHTGAQWGCVVEAPAGWEGEWMNGEGKYGEKEQWGEKNRRTMCSSVPYLQHASGFVSAVQSGEG